VEHALKKLKRSEKKKWAVGGTTGS
jgi:hypothetical protein